MKLKTKEAIKRLEEYASEVDEHGSLRSSDIIEVFSDVHKLIAAIEAMEPRPIPSPPNGGTFGITEPPYNGEQLFLIWNRPPAVLQHEVAFWNSLHKRWCRLHEFACNQNPESQPTHFIPLSALPQPEVKG